MLKENGWIQNIQQLVLEFTTRMPNIEQILTALVNEAKHYKTAFILYSGGAKSMAPVPCNYQLICGFSNKGSSQISHIGELDKLNEWVMGFLSYDLKNSFENLTSDNPDTFSLPDFMFIKPEHLIVVNNDNQFKVVKTTMNENFWNELIENDILGQSKSVTLEFKAETTKAEYIDQVEKIKKRIVNGDVYEMNYCQNFTANGKINPFETFLQFAKHSPSPFSSFIKLNHKYVLCTSMERFFAKKQNKVFSQPIKATLKRTGNNDQKERSMLLADEKERAENLMIVDLVRNDLNKGALTSSVKVEELFGIYSYTSVHQMISTISAEYDLKYPISKLIQDLFPMGSMTGAPKLNAMKFIDEHESFKRGLYSGSTGYIEPNGDCDFNVMIRTAFYDDQKQTISIPVGSAITYDSISEMEYNECLLKIEKIKRLLMK